MQRICIGQDQARLVKGADQVFAQRVVDPRLAANARIHLRDNGRGHLYVRYAAQIGRGHKARHVANHAPAEGHNPSTAVELGFDHLPENALGPVQILSLFTPGIDHLQHLEPSGAQAGGLQVADSVPPRPRRSTSATCRPKAKSRQRGPSSPRMSWPTKMGYAAPGMSKSILCIILQQVAEFPGRFLRRLRWVVYSSMSAWS